MFSRRVQKPADLNDKDIDNVDKLQVINISFIWICVVQITKSYSYYSYMNTLLLG